MKPDILLHIPMKYGADWYINSQKLQHNYCDISFSDNSILYQVKNYQYGLFCILEIRYTCTCMCGENIPIY